jgi:diguanylate cyclase (GGDEF)-like protein
MNESETSRHALIDTINNNAWESMLAEPERALASSRDALERSRGCGYEAGRANALLNSGWCLYYLSRYSEAISSYDEALDSFRALGLRDGVMKTLNASGVVYYTLGRYDTAVDYYMQSLEISRETGNLEREAAALNSLGELFRECGNEEEAIRYLLAAMEVLSRFEDRELSADVYANIGSSFMMMGNPTLALEYLETALCLSSEIRNRINEARCLDYLGKVSVARNHLAEADAYFLRSIAICDESKNVLGCIPALLDLGDLRVSQNRGKEALECYEKGLEQAQATNAPRYIVAALRSMALFHEKNGNPALALEYFRKFYREERESLNEDTKNKVRNISIQYEIEKSQREAEIFRLKNVELKEKSHQLEDRNRQILSIARIGQRITSSLDMAQVMETVYESIKELVDVNGFGIALYDETAGVINYKLFIEDGKRVEPFVYPVSSDSSYAAWCIRNGREVLINDKEKEKAAYVKPTSLAVGMSAQSLIYLPLMMENRTIGVMTVQSLKKNAYGDQDLQLLKALSIYVGIALENSKNHDRVNRLNELLTAEKTKLERAARRIVHLANHDNLTGLPNRRLLMDLLRAALPQADRMGTKVAVLFIDLDDFKPINDRFGHNVGDAALIAFAERLRKLLRASDTVARIGGDEFIALLPNVKQKEDVRIVLDKLYEDYRSPLEVKGSGYNLGFSIGAAMYPDDEKTADGLLSKADEAMYFVKRRQKHGYAFFDETHGEGALPK